MATGSFYHYCRAKEGLGVEMLRPYCEQHAGRLREALTEKTYRRNSATRRSHHVRNTHWQLRGLFMSGARKRKYQGGGKLTRRLDAKTATEIKAIAVEKSPARRSGRGRCGLLCRIRADRNVNKAFDPEPA